MAGTAVVAGVAVLVLVLAVTVLSVTFATRGAMATNRPIVEVLHYVGATDGFVASQFQRHFLMLGFKGGAIGGGAAILLFGCHGGGATPGLPGRRAATRRRRCSAISPSASPAIWRSSSQIVVHGGGDGVCLAPHRQPHLGDHRLSECELASIDLPPELRL